MIENSKENNKQFSNVKLVLLNTPGDNKTYNEKIYIKVIIFIINIY